MGELEILNVEVSLEERLLGQMAQGFQKLINNFNRTVVQLGSHFHNLRSEQSRLFNFTVKNHILEHIGADAAVVNPALVWGYPSEDFLMKVRKMVQSSIHGSGPLRAQNVMMFKYAHGLQLELLPAEPLLGWEGPEKRGCLSLQDAERKWRMREINKDSEA